MSPPRFAVSLTIDVRERSADRRSGAAAPVGGRVTYARRRQRAPCVASATLASRRSTAAIVGPGPRGMKQEGFTVCELLASARSGGGRVPGASRGLLASANARDAASCPALAMPREEHPRRTGWQDYNRLKIILSSSEVDVTNPAHLQVLVSKARVASQRDRLGSALDLKFGKDRRDLITH